MLLADLDADGKLDIAATTAGVGLSLLYGNGNATFQAATTLNVALAPQGVTAGRLNADTYLDLVITDTNTKYARTYVTSGARTYSLASTVGPPINPSAVALRDLDGDGLLDMVVTASAITNVGSGSMVVYRGTGNGTFGTMTQTYYGSAVGQGATVPLAFADINADGNIDLVTVNNGHVITLVGLGNGNVLAGKTLTMFDSRVRAVATADFDRDGILDAAFVYNGNPNFAVYYGDGNGAFPRSRIIPGGLVNPSSLSVGDFDGDGSSDLVVTTLNNDGVVMFRNAGDGNLALSANYTSCALPLGTAVADINQDGLSDVVVACGNGGNLRLHLNDGKGGLLAGTSVGNYGAGRYSVAVADFNGDGLPDLVASHGAGLSVLMGQAGGTFAADVPYSTPFALHLLVGDVNEDGRPDVLSVSNARSPALFLTQANGALVAGPALDLTTRAPTFSSGAIGDINGDGHLDIVVNSGNGQATTDAAALYTWFGKGDGNFTTVQAYPQFFTSNAVMAVVDLNRDGLADVLVPQYAGNLLTSLLNTGCPKITLGSPNSTRSVVAASATPTVANNSNQLTLTVTIADAYRVPLANQAVTVAVTGGNNALSPNAGSTDANGTFTTVLRSSAAESKTVTFTAGPATVQRTVTFVAGPAAVANSSYGASPSTIWADNNNTSTLSTLVRDAFGNLVAGQAVNFFATGSNTTLSSSSAASDANGLAQVTLKTSTAQAQTTSAQLGGSQVGQQTVTSLVGPPTVANSSYTITPNTGLVADGNQAASLAVVLRDAVNRPVVNVAVAFAPHAALGGVQTSRVVSDGNGRATSKLGSLLKGTFPERAFAGGIVLSSNATFTGRPICSTTASLGTVPSFRNISGNISGVSLGKLDGDNFADLLVTRSIASSLAVLQGSTSGVFTSAGTVQSPNNLFAWSGLADVNRDGNTDVVGLINAPNANILLVALNDGNASFGTPITTALPNAATFGAVADLTNDGFADLVVLNANSSYTVLVNNGNVHLANARNFALPAQATRVAAGDVDGDGRQDLVFACPSTKTVVVTLGDNAGNFGSAISYTVPITPGPLVVGQFTGDNLADVVVASSTTPEFYQLRATGGGALTSNGNAVVSGISVTALATARLNADANFDLLVVSDSVDNLGAATYLGRGDGTFTFKARWPSTYHALAAAVGDVNGDGNQDLVMANILYPQTLLGDGNGGVVLPRSVPLPNVAASAAAVDWGADGNVDVAYVATNANEVGILLGNGQGNFTLGSRATTKDAPWSMVATDTDDDGLVDLVIAHANDDNLLVIRNQLSGDLALTTSVPACRALAASNALVKADVDGDGREDLVLLCASANNAMYVRRTAANAFAAPVSIPLPDTSRALHLGDLDNDGKLDLVVVGGVGGGNTLTLSYGNGDGTFSGGTTTAVGATLAAVVPGDFDGDGYTDFFVGARSALGATVRGGATRPATVAPWSTSSYSLGAVAPASTQVVVTDLNQDGVPDVVYSTWRFGGVGTALSPNGIFGANLNQTPIFPFGAAGATTNVFVVADFNRDNKPDLAVLTDGDTNQMSVMLQQNCTTP